MGSELLQTYIDTQIRNGVSLTQQVDLFKLWRFKEHAPDKGKEVQGACEGEKEKVDADGAQPSATPDSAGASQPQPLEDSKEASAEGSKEPVQEKKQDGRWRSYKRELQPTGAAEFTKLLVDVEASMHFLCSGIQVDWICGGEWSSIFVWLRIFTEGCRDAYILPVPAFNAALEVDYPHMRAWCREQLLTAYKVQQIFQLVQNGRTPYVKALWCAPIGTELCMRSAFRMLNVWCAASLSDHPMEVSSYASLLGADGVFGRLSQVAQFMNARCFSADAARLRGPYALTTQELLVDQLATNLHLSIPQMIMLSVLLGIALSPTPILAIFLRFPFLHFFHFLQFENTL